MERDIVMIRMETVDVKTVLDESFPSVTNVCVTIETPSTKRCEMITSFQKGEIDILIATPGIVGRGLELKSAKSVGMPSPDQPDVVVVLCFFCFRVRSSRRSFRTQRRGRLCDRVLQCPQQEVVQGICETGGGESHPSSLA